MKQYNYYKLYYTRELEDCLEINKKKKICFENPNNIKLEALIKRVYKKIEYQLQLKLLTKMLFI